MRHYEQHLEIRTCVYCVMWREAYRQQLFSSHVLCIPIAYFLLEFKFHFICYFVKDVRLRACKQFDLLHAI